MDDTKLRAWWWHRQGLDGSLAGAAPATVLARAGWARSVGGAGPYLSLFARAGTSRADADASAAQLDIYELPAARGCTYVLPASDYPLALTLAQSFGDAELNIARKLGVTDKEIETLSAAVLETLSDEPLDPDAIKQVVGKLVRNLGEEGKKKGMSTTLPLALGMLQRKGLIRRVPTDGRLDQQRYRYTTWSPSPLAGSRLTLPEAHTELARRFFSWVGPATMKEFQWFGGLGVKVAADAVAPLGLVEVEPGSNRLMFPADKAAYDAFRLSSVAQYKLVSGLDSISAARRNVDTLVDADDWATVSAITFGDRPGSNVVDLSAHAIFDRGRLIGYWEYDKEKEEIAWALFAGKPAKALLGGVRETETFVREQLGDARWGSIDSPKSRAPKIAAIRRMK